MRSSSHPFFAPDSRTRALGGMLAVAAFLCLTVLVFLPAEIYYGNVTEFPNSFADMLPSVVAVALLFTLLLTGVLMALPRGRVRDIGVTVLFALAFLAWFQGNVLVWKYGVLDGRPIDWTAHRYHGLIDAAVWCLVLATAVFAFRFVNRIAATASVAFILLQAISISVQAARSPDRWIDHFTFDDSARFSFSRTTNVVILVLDTFQSDLFQELLDDDPGLAERFRGFTFFRNAVGGFPSTAASIPLILTGRYYDNASPFQDFVRSTYSTASLPQALKAANFHVYYHNPYFWPSLYADEAIASHASKKRITLYDPISWQRATRLRVLGLFRGLPQAGKQLLQSAPAVAAPTIAKEATPWQGDPFFIEMAARTSATMTTPTFKYYHLWGIHPPLTHDENLKPERLPFTRQNAKRQAKGVLRQLDTFLATLVEREIYDGTLLFVVGDHVTTFDPRLVEVDGRVRTRPSGVPVATENSFGLPLVLVKPIGATGLMKVSDAPVSLSDIPRTVASAVALTADFPGESMLNPALPVNRPRRVLKYDPDALRLTDRYFPPLTEYVVSGFSWLDESWRQTGREFLQGETRTRDMAYAYPWGRPLRFGLRGNAQPYLNGGWSAPEDEWNWTRGKSARLRFMTDVPQRDLVVRANVVPALPGGLLHQRAGLFVNGRKVGEWLVASAGEYTATIPREIVPGGEWDLVLALPDAVAPHSVRPELPDERVLALAMVSAVLEEEGQADARRVEDTFPLPLGTVIRLGSGSKGSRYLAGGWSAPEPGHNWTSASTAVLRFRTPAPPTDLLFALSATPFVVKGRLDRQRVSVSINKEKLGEWSVSKTAVYGVRIHKEWLSSPTTEIELELLDAAVPKRIDPALKDHRQLGLSVDSIMVDHDVRGGTPVFPTGDTIVLTREEPPARFTRKRPQ